MVAPASKRVIENKVVEKNKEVEVSGGNKIKDLASELYIGLAEQLNKIIGNASTNKRKKGTLVN